MVEAADTEFGDGLDPGKPRPSGNQLDKIRTGHTCTVEAQAPICADPTRLHPAAVQLC